VIASHVRSREALAASQLRARLEKEGNPMRNKWILLPAVLSGTLLVLLGVASPAPAQTPWVRSSMYLFQVTNNCGDNADNFLMVIGGIHISDLDPSGYYNSDYTAPSVFEDYDGLHILWSRGSTPYGDSDTFGFTVNRPASFTSCKMYWMRDGYPIGLVEDVWQDWTVFGGSVHAAINNRAGITKWVRRLGGYTSYPVNISDLASMSAPPNQFDIDPLAPLGATQIDPGNPLSFDYAPYSGNRSLYMYYDVYAGPWQNPVIRFRNVANVAPPCGILTFTKLVNIPDRCWYPGSSTSPYNEVLGVSAAADNYEDITLSSLSLYPNGSGDSSTAISSVDVWMDVDHNGLVDPGVDQLIASGVFPPGYGQLTMTLSSPRVIPAGGRLDLLISLTMNPSAAPGSDYGVSLFDAYGQGNTSGIRVPVTGLNIDSARLVIGVPPISIGEAKKLPIDPNNGMTDILMLENKVVTGDFQTSLSLVYLEEPDRSAGIGVMVPPQNGPGPIPVGSRVSVVGRLTLLDGAELIMEPIGGAINPGTPIAPLLMSNKFTGGGAFGNQPAVFNAPDSGQMAGMSNVGMLVRTYGKVTGLGRLAIGGLDYDVAWIDDGSGLADGFNEWPGIAVLKPLDWQGNPPSGYLVATGILRAIPNPHGNPVRLLVPRSQGDARSF